jgi:hypothetical protein
MRVRKLADEESSRLILRAGAYVGEVIRRHTPPPRRWHWLDYEQAAKVQPMVASLGMSIGTAAVLWDGDDGVTFPLAKVAKYLVYGQEDSVKIYAQVIVADRPPQAN